MPHPAPVALTELTAPDNLVATAFVLHDAAGHELDIHVLRATEAGAVPAWNSTFSFAPDAFTATGLIAGRPVRCLSAATHMRTHSGYAPQQKDIDDLRHLHACFGVAYLPEQADLAER